jgi:hypothetical protein
MQTLIQHGAEVVDLVTGDDLARSQNRDPGWIGNDWLRRNGADRLRQLDGAGRGKVRLARG